MINIYWILAVIAAVISQWYIIEEKERYPKKKLWFLTRIVVAGIFMYFYVINGYMWYWALPYMAFTFWFPFNFSLNILRGMAPFYLSARNSSLDALALKIFKYPSLVYQVSFLLMLASVGIMYFYGTCTWQEVNEGL